MPVYKLSYFDATGKAELIRLCFAYGNLEFEDFRFTREQFGELKNTYPTKQAPVLEVDGVMYAQSIALARYVAKQTGLYPKDDLEALKADMCVDTLTDAMNAVIKVMFGPKEGTEEYESLKKTFLEEQLPKYYGALENLVAGKFFNGDQVTYADIFMFNIAHNFSEKMAELHPTSYPKLSALIENVKALPTIAAYLSK